MEYKRFVFGDTVRVESLAYCELDEDFTRSKPHMHACSELFFVLEGELIVEADAPFTAGAGWFAAVGANVLHRERAGRGPCKHYILSVGLDLAGVGVHSFRPFYNETAAALKEAAAEAASYKPYSLERAAALAAAAAVPALRAAGGAIESETAADGGCFKVKNAIDGGFAADLTLKELAGLACRSEEHLIRTFRRAYGVTPMRYLKSRRMAEAKTLLRSTDLNVSEIGSLVGYDSAAWFAADFKREEGITPTEYRKRTK